MNFLTLDADVPQVEATPSWMVAADNHNLGNNYGGSWYDPSTWAEKFQNAGKFISVSVLSGANSFYNSGVTVGNWFGADAAQRENDQWISALDSDLGAYYAENREAADLAGFIAGSFIPGLGGIKILSAGQKALGAATRTGFLGTNISAATGLLVPKVETFVKLAASDLARTNASFSLINANVAKALGSGVWQGVLEGAAFETAVQATMFKSTILDSQDTGDIVKNIVVGGILNGVIGGAFTASKTLTSLKKEIRAEDIRAKFATEREFLDEAFRPSDKAIFAAYERQNAGVPVLLEGGDVRLYDKDVANYLDKQRKINNDIRNQLQSMAGKDSEVANLLADTFHVNPKAMLAGESNGNAEVIAGNILHAEQAVRVNRLTAIEQEIAKNAKMLDLEANKGLSVRYVKILGEGAGEVSVYEPVVLSIADKVLPRAGRTTQEAVMEEVKKYGFATKKLWSAANLTGLSAHNEAEARYIWFRTNADTIKLVPGKTIFSQGDIPALEHVFERKAWDGIKWVDSKGTAIEFKSSGEMYDFIKEAKETVANTLLERMVFEGSIPVEYGTDAIARITNTRRAFLEGDRIPANEFNDLFARQGLNKAYDAARVESGLSFKSDPLGARTEFLPEYTKVSYRIPAATAELNGTITDALSYFAAQEKLFQQAVERVFLKGTGDLATQFPELTNEMLLSTSRIGSGPGFITFAAGKYGSIEAAMEQAGSGTQRLQIAFKEAAKLKLNSALVALSQDTKSAIEVSAIWSKISSTSEHYILAEDASIYGLDAGPALVARKLAKRGEASEEGFESVSPLLQPGAPESIPIVNQKAYDALRAHQETNAVRVNLERDRQSALGRTNYKDPEVVYPVRPNTADYKHFAFVVDPRVTGAGHVSMIHAASEQELNQLISKVRALPEYQVLLKADTEEFFKANRSYDFERTLNENYIDSDLRKRGIASEFFIKTDSQKIADDMLNHHMRQEDISAVELVRMKYQKQFDFLEDQAGQYSKIESSRYGTTLERVEKYEKNPYISYLKTALNISRSSEYPLLSSFNRALDGAVSRVVARVSEIWGEAKTPADLDGINTALKEAGYNNAYYDAATNLYANHVAPKGELSKFIRGANALMSKFTLGLDPMNALNNTIGANVLRGTELAQITRAIREKNPELLGELGNLTKIALPGVDAALVTSPVKLMASAVKEFFGENHATLLAKYKSAGYIRNLSEQFHSMLDDVALRGTETVEQLTGKLQSAFNKAKLLVDKGETYTGNTFAEEFNRFLSANVMDQITSVAVRAGVISEREAGAYINTFVNRVEGNTIASQRPLIFSGPIGQAIGLFQSYQFNLMQNLFRYVGEGRGKDVATLLGLQGTFYGLNGMPGFSYVNQHIVGTASGNSAHRDAYDAAYGIAGKTAGEFLLYGLPSFALQSNLYTRGDINPRQVTVVPTTLADVPIVGAFSKFFGAMKSVADNVNNGTPVWQSFLQGVEHNGISRPLAGVAQVLRGASNGGNVYSTTSRGTIMGQNDFLSWGSMVRLAGARPMDEAIVNDAVFRIKAYESVDRARRMELASSIKISTRFGETPEEEQVAIFAERYAATGGRSSQFNKWMMENMKKADVSQSAQIMKQISNPLTFKMQGLMGGDSEP